MSIQYPNGKVYMAKQKGNASSITKATYSNRGMTLEQDLNDTNQYYLTHGIACIHKKPTPIQIVKVEYPKRSAAMIKEGYFKQPSTTDYNGVYKGKHVDFEAKETQNKTSFPLQNFHLHQIEHMRRVIDQGGITFVIIKFTATDEIYLLDAAHLLLFWKRYEGGGRKSITKLEMETNGHLIRQGFQPRIDYLATLDRLYFSV